MSICSYGFGSGANFPIDTAVLIGETTDDKPGRWQIADKVKYKKDEKFGVDGLSEVGEYEGAGGTRNTKTNTGTTRVKSGVE